MVFPSFIFMVDSTMNVKGRNIIQYALEVPKNFPSKTSIFSINIDEHYLLDYILTIFLFCLFQLYSFASLLLFLDPNKSRKLKRKLEYSRAKSLGLIYVNHFV